MFIGDRKIQTWGPTVPVGNKAYRESGPKGWVFSWNHWTVMIDSFLTYHLATYCIIFVDDVTEFMSMTHAVQSWLETAIEEQFKQWTNASKGFTTTTLSATVSKFVEENQFIFIKSARLPSLVHSVTSKHVTHAMHFTCTKHFINV